MSAPGSALHSAFRAALMVAIVLLGLLVGADSRASDQTTLTGTVPPPAATAPPQGGGIQVATLIGRVNMDGRAHCTGTLVGDNLVLTASHCLWDKKGERWFSAEEVHFVAGYNQYGFAAHSRSARLAISREADPARFLETSAFPNDWAILVLEKPIGKTLGHVELLDPRLTEQRLDNLLIIGYRRDRAHALSAERDCVASPDPWTAGLMLHSCMGTFGVSGGPLMGVLNRKPVLAGVVIGIIERDGAQHGAAINHAKLFGAVQAMRRGDMATAGNFLRFLN